jgi:hypothetical protein
VAQFTKRNKVFVCRNLVIKKKYEDVQARRQQRAYSKEVCFVWLGGTLDDLIKTLTKARSFVQPQAYIR